MNDISTSLGAFAFILQRRTIAHLIVAMLALSAFAGPVAAQTSQRAQHYSLTVVSRSDSHSASGDNDLALDIHLDEGWHIYWINPGETGYAPAVNWTLPDGMKAGLLEHPAPVHLMLGGFSSNVHEGRTIMLQSLHGGHGGGTLTGELDLLVCSDSLCVPDPLPISVTLVAGDGADNPKSAALFARARATLPPSADQAAAFERKGQQLFVRLPSAAAVGLKNAHVFVAAEHMIDEAKAQEFRVDGNDVIVALPLIEGGEVADTISIIYKVSDADGGIFARAFTATLGQVNGDQVHTTIAASGAFFLSLGAAFLGGLLLNLMPCVFPILSLKAMALARSGGDETDARREAVGYTIGAVGVILALGIAILTMREMGHSIGWAFQLQDGRVLAMLTLLVVAIAMNMAGLFELPSVSVNGQAKSGFIGAVGTGALAAFIATPCTGPFMAGALGAAMVMPTAQGLAIFAGLGLGLAAPFLLIGFSPRARGWLPKPGVWMVRLRQLLSLPMFATALGLLWIIGRQQGVSGMTGALGLSMMLGLSLWWLGMRQHEGKRVWPVAVPVLAAVAIALMVPASPNVAIAAEQGDATIPYSAQRLLELQAKGKPVLLYLTADWCLTCKVNERTSLSTSAVLDSFSKHEVTVMRGDWTNGDAAITQFLKDNGKAGVPVYFWYRNGQKTPVELPQILTPDMLIDLAQKVD